MYVFIFSLSFFQFGFILGANNQVSAILDVQFGLSKQSEKTFYHTMISSSAVLGAVIGAFFGGRIITKVGRRKTLVYFNFLGLIFVFPTIVENFYTLCFGRLGLGLCGGIFQVALPRTIEETVPFHLLGSFGILTNLAINGGQMIGMIMGIALPDATDIEGCRDS